MPGIVLSIVVAALDLVVATLGWTTLRVVTKPLVAVILAVVIWRAGSKTIAAGLIAAAVGDELLLNPGATFFLLGMIAFVAMHASYITAFWRAGLNRPNARSSAIGLAYIAALVGSDAILVPSAGTFAVPLVAYGTFLVAMAYTALDVAPLTAIGGAIFMSSDTLLAYLKFWPGFPFAPQSAMLVIDATYFAAQILIVAGLLNRKRTGDRLRRAV
jgi:uncharacterized membrane protein YhhN